jgi:hypothetical protein
MTQQKSEVRFSRLREYHEYKMRKSKQPSKTPTIMTFNIKCKVKRMTAKQQHRFLQMFQPDIDLRRFAHFTAQSLKFEELEKREKNPIRREYYHKLNILKQERARMYMERHLDKHHRGGIGTPSVNTGEMVITKEQAVKLSKLFRL